MQPTRTERLFIADTHFFHENIVRHCARPANHTEILVHNLQAMMQPNYILIVGGDVCFGNAAQLRAILASIPGIKYLIRGNHDKWTNRKYFDCGFSGVFDAIEIGQAYITHKPTTPPDGKINVHGHLHNLGYDNQECTELFGESYLRYYDEKHRLYSPELENYRPVNLKEMLVPKRASTANKDMRHGVIVGAALREFERRDRDVERKKGQSGCT